MTARTRTAAPAMLAAVLAGVLLATVAATPASGAPLARTTALISTPTGVLDPGTNGASFAGASAEGGRVFFETTQRLSPDDAESNRRDVYERSGGTTSLVSQATGIADPASADASFAGATPDGDRVFLISPERLTADDNDSGRIDIYERANGVTTLVSGATGVPDPDTADVQFRGISRDGTRVVFITTQKLTADDNDTNRSDVYVRSGGVTTLISAPTGVADPDTAGVTFAVPSADGSRVFFTTAQKLTADDADSGRADLYERSGGATTLVSAATGVPNPDTAGVQGFAGASDDGSRVFFNTSEKLTADDGDTGRHDVYERSGGATTLASVATGVPDPDSGDAFATHVSKDGSRVFFITPQKLAPDDADTARWDAYERSGGATRLVSGPTGVPDPDSADVLIGSPFGGVSEDGSRVFFTTTQKLTADDGDSGRADVYERSGDTTKLVSAPTGVADPDLADVDFRASSRDGSRVFFTTTEKLTADDGDTNRQDVYERSEGTTTLISRPAGVADPDTGDADFGGASADGSDVFFTTSEALTADDEEPNLLDVYAARAPQPDPGPGPGPDVTAPALSGYGLSPSIFRAASRGPAVARRRPVGTRVRHTLSEPARVTFRVERAVKGVRVRGKCRAPSRGKRGARPCVRYVTLRGSVTQAGLAGPNRLRFTGRLRGRGLRPGRYRLTARAVDAAGNASSVARRPFRIVRR